jgi:hypothetical protein
MSFDTRAQLPEYQAELDAVRDSLLETCRDLVRDLNGRDLPIEAMAVDEAQLYLRAAFKSLNRVLVAVQHGKRFR